MSLRLELDFYKCPKCNRILKPTIKKGESDLQFVHSLKGYRKDLSPDYLICRYCNISIKASKLREQKDPIKFLKQFTKIPNNKEILEEEANKIISRGNHDYNMKKYRHSPIPTECPNCRSKEDIVADSSDYNWICLKCDYGFEWKSYRIIFHGDTEIEAENEDDALEMASDLLGSNCKVDIETEADWIDR